MTDHQTYYLAAPGGHFALKDCPSEDAAFDFAVQKFGRHAVEDWALSPAEPSSDLLATFDWFDEAEEAWLAFGGWPGLVAILTGEECGFADQDLCVALTQKRGPVTAAVLRIASNYIDGALGAAEKAASAGVSGAQDAYDAIVEDVAGWLWREAREWEQSPPGGPLPGGQVVAVLTEEAQA